MLNERGFDLWADEYDKSVGLSEENGTYPFAGYRDILNFIYNDILIHHGKKVLDLGFGTGTLSKKLYDQGCLIYGQDFSNRMIEISQGKMPMAKLYQGDFWQGLAEPLKEHRYDAVVATYSLHHLSDQDKVSLLQELCHLLNEDGVIYIGDIAFRTREDLERCKKKAGDRWDDEEIYFVYDEIKKELPGLRFEPYSSCAGVFMIARSNFCNPE